MVVKVGDRLFAVSRVGIRIDARWIVVDKIGRKWAEFRSEGRTSFGRFDIETMKIDGGSFTSAGRVYPSEDAYREVLRLDELWTELRRRIDQTYIRPLHLTEISILKAADALGIRLESE